MVEQLGEIKDYSIPVVTPKGDEDFRRVIRRAAADGEGANNIFILGTTGEFYVLPEDFRKAKTEVGIDEVAKLRQAIQKPIKPLEIAIGITAPNLEETVRLAKHAEEQLHQQGVPGFLVLMPGYLCKDASGDYTRRGIPSIVRTVLDNTQDTPIILYTHSGLTGHKNMRTATWKVLATDPRIPYLKASATDYGRIKNYQKAAHGNAKVLIGDAGLALRMESDGGVIGDGNILPVPWGIAVRRNHEAPLEGNLADQLLELRVGYLPNAIGAFKRILADRGVISSPETFDPELADLSAVLPYLNSLPNNDTFNRLFDYRRK